MTISKGLSSLDLVDSEEPSEDSEADMHWLRAFFLGRDLANQSEQNECDKQADKVPARINVPRPL